jgi:hypothetical protein
MKFYKFWIISIILISCNQISQSSKPSRSETIPQIKDSILVRILRGASDGQIDSCVYVSYQLEKDTGYNNLLREYLCHNQFGADTSFPLNTMAELANRASFYNLIMLFYDGDKYNKVTYYGEKSRLDDLRRGFLFSIRSCCPDPLHNIADALLQRGYFDGVECLWELTDLSKLPSWKEYLSKLDTANFYQVAKVSAIFQNIGNDSMRDIYLSKAERLIDHRQEFDRLKALMDKNKTFSQGMYNGAVYGEQ